MDNIRRFGVGTAEPLSIRPTTFLNTVTLIGVSADPEGHLIELVELLAAD